MASMSVACGSRAPCLTSSRKSRTQRPAALPQAAGIRSTPAIRSIPALQRQSLAVPNSRCNSACQAYPMQVAEVAGEFAEITGYATVMFAITLVGLAVGFVLLRFEALVEEGKLDDVLK